MGKFKDITTLQLGGGKTTPASRAYGLDGPRWVFRSDPAQAYSELR